MLSEVEARIIDDFAEDIAEKLGEAIIAGTANGAQSLQRRRGPRRR